MAFENYEHYDYRDHILNQAYLYKSFDETEKQFKDEIRALVVTLNPFINDYGAYINFNNINIREIRSFKEEYYIKDAIKKAYNNLPYKATIPVEVVLENLEDIIDEEKHKEIEDKFNDEYLDF